MSYNNENIFAKILRGEIPCDKVYENDQALAFKDINPQAPVHILVIPKGPYISYADFGQQASDAELAGFMRAVGEVAKQLGVTDRGSRILSNQGENGHQEVPHFHVHLLGGKDLGGAIHKVVPHTPVHHTTHTGWHPVHSMHSHDTMHIMSGVNRLLRK